ncbi:MAG: polysaccharide lyase family 8 super-sandwich domain-containing protein, partial [Verrucomicrobiota bacterium]|nr:polysaccharide lyase family 8 super-sandwich domain-containing protein [Verrucomicrobiota bacterium]
CSPLERVWGNYYEYALDVEINETPEALFAKIGSFFNEDGAPKGKEFYRVMNPMLSLVQLYQSPNSPGYHDPAIKAEIFRMMEIWLRVNPDRGTNWWTTEIGVPRVLSKISILMLKELRAERPDLLDGMVEQIKPAERQLHRWLGANLGDVCTSSVALGVMLNDEERIRTVLQLVGDKLMKPAYGGTEGFHVDGSFSYHNKGGLRQLHDGSYGMVFIDTVADLLWFFRGTELKVSANCETVFVDYVLDGYQWKVFEGQIDPHCSGRSMYTRGRKIVPVPALLRLGDCCGYRQEELRQFALRVRDGNSPDNFKAGNKMFPMTDFMVNRGRDYYMSVRMSSTRTLFSEGGSQWASADGVALVMRTSEEYDDVFSSWDLNRVPGTTAEYFTPAESQIPRDAIHELNAGIRAIHKDIYARRDLVTEYTKKYIQPDWERRSGAYDTAGGVSDGEYGCCGFEFSRGNAYAKKAWFFFGNQWMALGADIQSPGGSRPIYTSVEQSNASGDVVLGTADAGIVVESAVAFGANHSDLQWVSHNQIGYVFPESGRVRIQKAIQRFPLSRIVDYVSLHHPNYSLATTDAQKNVFSLWFDHGVAPAGQTYAYQVLVGVSAEETARAAAHSDLEIIQNTSKAQCVENRREQVIQALFYESGTLRGKDWELDVQIDHPKVLMIRMNGDAVVLSGADPQMNPGTVLKGSFSRDGGWNSRFELVLPEGVRAGGTESLVLELE